MIGHMKDIYLHSGLSSFLPPLHPCLLGLLESCLSLRELYSCLLWLLLWDLCWRFRAISTTGLAAHLIL